MSASPRSATLAALVVCASLAAACERDGPQGPDAAAFLRWVVPPAAAETSDTPFATQPVLRALAANGREVPVPTAFQVVLVGAPEGARIVGDWAIGAGGRAEFSGLRIAGPPGPYAFEVRLAGAAPLATAIEIHSPAPNFRSMTAGSYVLCGLDAEGNASCMFDPATILTPSGGGMRFVRLAAGQDRVCGIVPPSEAWCWGGGALGQLGNGADTSAALPVRVSGGHAWAQLAGGGAHSCGITSANAAWCWGDGGEGQLGAAPPGGRSSVPVAVGGGHAFSQVAAGLRHTCALTQAGAAWCWGSSSGVAAVTTPAAVRGGHVFAQVVLGYETSCGITGTGEAYCWTGTDASGPGPQRFGGTLRFLRLAVAPNFPNSLCGIALDGRAWCWGSGSPGDGTTGSAPSWVPTLGGHRFSSIVIANPRCATTAQSVTYCWGGPYGNAPARIPAPAP